MELSESNNVKIMEVLLSIFTIEIFEYCRYFSVLIVPSREYSFLIIFWYKKINKMKKFSFSVLKIELSGFLFSSLLLQIHNIEV